MNQASARDVSGAGALSDDPSTDAPGDLTRFEVLFPALIVEKRVVDVDKSGFEPGDVVQYTFDLRVDAGVPVTGIALTDVLDEALVDPVVVSGVTVDAETGTVRADTSTEAALGQLRPGGSVALSFQATIGEEVPLGTQVQNRSRRHGDGLRGATLSDDPTTPTPDDPTSFVVEADTPAVLDGTTRP